MGASQQSQSLVILRYEKWIHMQASDLSLESKVVRKRRRTLQPSAASEPADGADAQQAQVPQCPPAPTGSYVVMSTRRRGTGGGGTLPPFPSLPPHPCSPTGTS
jgi:hypothetical protein